MSQVIKFPKEATLVKNALLRANNNKMIIKLKDGILKYSEYLKIEDIDLLFKAYFALRDFTSIIMISDELAKKEIYSLSFDYYVLLSFIILDDIYQAKNYLRRSKALVKYKNYYEKGEAYYSQILAITDPKVYKNSLTLIIAGFIVELVNEELSDEKLATAEDRHLYYFACFIDILNVLQELAYDKDIITMFSYSIEVMFEIKL